MAAICHSIKSLGQASSYQDSSGFPLMITAYCVCGTVNARQMGACLGAPHKPTHGICVYVCFNGFVPKSTVVYVHVGLPTVMVTLIGLHRFTPFRVLSSLASHKPFSFFFPRKVFTRVIVHLGCGHSFAVASKTCHLDTSGPDPLQKHLLLDNILHNYRCDFLQHNSKGTNLWVSMPLAWWGWHLLCGTRPRVHGFASARSGGGLSTACLHPAKLTLAYSTHTDGRAFLPCAFQMLL